MKFLAGIALICFTIMATSMTKESIIFQIGIFDEVRTLILFIGYGAGLFCVLSAIRDWIKGY